MHDSVGGAHHAGARIQLGPDGLAFEARSGNGAPRRGSGSLGSRATCPMGHGRWHLRRVGAVSGHAIPGAIGLTGESVFVNHFADLGRVRRETRSDRAVGNQLRVDLPAKKKESELVEPISSC